MTLRRCIGLAALAAALLAAPAHGDGAGTIVVRLATDPSPAGVSWSYKAGAAGFVLGGGVASHRIAGLADGTYTIAERSPDPARPATLTSIACTDPSGGSKGSTTTATATVSLSGGETVTCVFTHRALGPLPLNATVALARQFAPTLHLSAAEHYRPLAAPAYVADATLKSGKPPRASTAQTRPTLFTLPATTAATYLDVRGAQPYSQASQYRTIERQLEAAHRPTVYWRMQRQASTGRIALEYWFLYLYNDFVDRHEADWEGVTVFVKDGTPLGVTYSQHQGRAWTAWPAAVTDDHPVVYVAAGSHANYPLPGRYRVKVCFTIRVHRCTTTNQRDDARGDGATLTADSYDLHELGGTGYTGSWGSGNYVLGIGLTSDRVVDPRRRSEYSNPFASIPPGA